MLRSVIWRPRAAGRDTGEADGHELDVYEYERPAAMPFADLFLALPLATIEKGEPEAAATIHLHDDEISWKFQTDALPSRSTR